MVGGLIEKIKAYFALRTLDKNPIYRTAIYVIRETLGDTSSGLGKLSSEAFKGKLTTQIMSEVTEVAVSKEPLLENRKHLAVSVWEMAKYQVLVLPSAQEIKEEVTGLRGKPGISGELKPHLKTISEKNKEIKELVWSLNDPNTTDIFEACYYKYLMAAFRANVFQHIRIELGDYHKSTEKDWYRPFVAAMCAWEEHNYRKEIGLPDILSMQDSNADFAALKYSTYFNFVENGSRYPNFEWEEHYKSNDLQK